MKTRSMNSTRPQCPLVPGTTFLPAHDWNTIRDTMPPMYLTPTGIRSRSYIRASFEAVIAPVTAAARKGVECFGSDASEGLNGRGPVLRESASGRPFAEPDGSRVC